MSGGVDEIPIEHKRPWTRKQQETDMEIIIHLQENPDDIFLCSYDRYQFDCTYNLISKECLYKPA